MSNKLPVSIRRAVPKDGPEINRLIDALADYEHLERPLPDARQRILDHCFAENPFIEIWLAFVGDKLEPIAYSVICRTYSSFLAKQTLFMEDIFVLPEYRKYGAGKALFENNVALAKQYGCGRMEWQCLAWNDLAHGFYSHLGGRIVDGWVNYRLTEQQLNEFGKK
ncbi:MAG: GNAT family N-acetyltransferase [Candidatus Sumerlaeales bacterium]|nr:GNAT family N-acetyltransferase [Candidatus Sumerlaeales bacterium]